MPDDRREQAQPEARSPLEAQVAEIKRRHGFPAICERYEAMAKGLGNVSGENMIALVMLAIENR